jgi:thiamine biosynthesis lipoprotein
MGTVVSVQVLGYDATAAAQRDRADGVGRALAWFASVESVCSRFDPESELRRLSRRVGTPVPASPMLLEVVTFALAVADASQGAFDPTVGERMEIRGFDREFRSGAEVRSRIGAPDGASFRDVEVDAAAGTITLHRPLLLDLGAVAKGLAIDTAARELSPFTDFAVDAGGDLYLGGRNADGDDWSVGIRDPRSPERMLETLRVSDRAVCTSGDYERRVAGTPGDPGVRAPEEHHIMDPATGASSRRAASVTVVATSAMVADALATGAFVLGPEAGIALLERHAVQGLMITPTLDRFATREWPHD